MNKKIPHIIHYCWFGGNPLPKEMKKYINGWRQLCPDFVIKEWNETNFDVNCSEYVKEAYKAKKWAFVSDYARFKILYEEGGVYFDTDVELLKPIVDIISMGPYMGLQNKMEVAPGLGMAAYPGMTFCRDMIEMYDSIHFINNDSSRNIKTIVDYTTEYFVQKGLIHTDTIQNIEGVNIYPKEYFNPCDMETNKICCTEKTVSIHHYAGTWVDSYSLLRGKIYFFIRRMLGENIACIARKIFGRKTTKQ